MKHFTRALALLFALLIAWPAQAGWNLRQNDDGTTDWVREDSEGTLDTMSIGERYLVVRITRVAEPGTYAIAIPMTDVKVTFIQSVITGALTGSNTILSFWNLASGETLAALSNMSTSKEISNTTSKMTIAATTGTAVATNFVAFAVTNTVDTFTPTANNTLGRGSMILIHTDGGSSDVHNDSGNIRTTDAVITITIKKR